MPPFDQHLLSFVIRCIHVMSMAFMLGGAILCWGLSRPDAPTPDQYPRLLVLVTQKYEFFFWTAIGIQIITGIGNIGAIGTGLLGPTSAWGLKLTIKLFAFLLLMLLSLPRTTFNARLNLVQLQIAQRAKLVSPPIPSGTSSLGSQVSNPSNSSPHQGQLLSRSAEDALAQELIAVVVRPGLFRGLYAGTALFVAGIVVLAVSLAHG